MYGVAAVAVIFVIGTGLLAMRGKPDPSFSGTTRPTNSGGASFR